MNIIFVVNEYNTPRNKISVSLHFSWQDPGLEEYTGLHSDYTEPVIVLFWQYMRL